MRCQYFDDFDAFAESVRGVESKMILRNPKRRIWTLSHVDLPAVQVQLGRLGGGNIAQGELRPDAYLLYMPLTDACEYTANGTVLDKNSFAILEPGCEFCISTKVEHDWCAATVPMYMFDDLVPVHYLQLRQLHRALKGADPAAVSVSEVLVAHGEREFGRFAARYRRLFGELPSETLRASR